MAIIYQVANIVPCMKYQYHSALPVVYVSITDCRAGKVEPFSTSMAVAAAKCPFGSNCRQCAGSGLIKSPKSFLHYECVPFNGKYPPFSSPFSCFNIICTNWNRKKAFTRTLQYILYLHTQEKS